MYQLTPEEQQEISTRWPQLAEMLTGSPSQIPLQTMPNQGFAVVTPDMPQGAMPSPTDSMSQVMNQFAPAPAQPQPEPQMAATQAPEVMPTPPPTTGIGPQGFTFKNDELTARYAAELAKRADARNQK